MDILLNRVAQRLDAGIHPDTQLCHALLDYLARLGHLAGTGQVGQLPHALHVFPVHLAQIVQGLPALWR